MASEARRGKGDSVLRVLQSLLRGLSEDDGRRLLGGQGSEGFGQELWMLLDEVGPSLRVHDLEG